LSCDGSACSANHPNYLTGYAPVTCILDRVDEHELIQ